MRKALLYGISLCLLFASAPLQAQEAPIIERLMRVVPLDQLSDVVVINYVDHSALQKALPNSERPAGFEDWRARRDTPSVQWYMTGLRFLGTTDSALVSASIEGERMRDAVGFDYYTVDQALEFGAYPTTGRLYTGKFDQDAVQSAFLARDYTRFERDTLIVLCGDATCDADRVFASDTPFDPSNPFGGTFGRRDPLALAEGIIFSTPVMSVFEGMLAAYNDSEPSLLQNDAVRALLSALNAEGTVVQAIFFDSALIGTDTAGIAPYTFGAIVHILREGGDQPSYIALVYDVQHDAQAIAADLSERVRRAERVTDRIRQSGGRFGTVQIVQAQSDAPYVLLMPINSQAPRSIPQGDIASARPAPLVVFSNLAFSLRNFDFGFLAVRP